MNKIHKEIIVCMLKAWLDNGMPLPGDICYQDVLDMLHDFEIDVSEFLNRIQELENMVQNRKVNKPR
jgi:uncharacterized protein YqcC (DUF446 family)